MLLYSKYLQIPDVTESWFYLFSLKSTRSACQVLTYAFCCLFVIILIPWDSWTQGVSQTQTLKLTLRNSIYLSILEFQSAKRRQLKCILFQRKHCFPITKLWGLISPSAACMLASLRRLRLFGLSPVAKVPVEECGTVRVPGRQM